MEARFHGTCLITSDVASLAAFYATVLDTTVRGGDPFAVVSVSGAVLSIYSSSGMETMVPGSMAGARSGNFTLEFEVDDVDNCYERLLAAAIPIVKPPTTQPWGRRSVWLRDPDGNIVNLYRPTSSTDLSVDASREGSHSR
ncbi:catechol 2,3-dioxygenase-like lactoylglutathione lyase family enzyme [Hamadaea flava]|uniref:VOC family protein n=1 Tax=Hamadaea flava TaxID=1742688 RepID=A0ABV8LR12_9ACTN|nr:VOC family protein [Hamadaea flava]MCP2323348.1 catechol 2,3-dioxygenase-like lactoylglutathione lyase family enzyme [Hamadaea flava]